MTDIISGAINLPIQSFTLLSILFHLTMLRSSSSIVTHPKVMVGELLAGLQRALT